EPDELADLQNEGKGSCSGAFDPVSSLQVQLDGDWGNGPLHLVHIPNEILPTPTGGDIFCGTQECQMSRAASLTEQVEPAAFGTVEGSCSGYGGCDTSLRANSEGRWESSPMHIKRGKFCEADIAGDTSFCDVLDYEGDHAPSASDEPVDEVQTATAVVEEGKKPVDVEGESSNSDESSSSSSSQGQLNQRQRKKCATLYDCRFCPYVTVSERSIVDHERIHTGERPFSCSLCQMAFAHRSTLSVHLSTHMEKGLFICSACQPYKCNTCGKEFTEKWRIRHHQAMHMKKKRFKCPVCSKAFRSKKSMHLHQEAHEREAPRKSGTRDGACAEELSLKIRQDDVHTGEEPSKCSTRIEAAKSMLNLTARGQVLIDLTHETHENERSVACVTHPEAFQRESSLPGHQGNLEAETPYKCETCNKAFTLKEELKGHQEFKCPACPKEFCMKTSLDSHDCIHKGKMTYKCVACSMIFTRLCDISKHRAIH
ncbi:unnamed protein product, partial [Ixodes hexagonus]